MKSNCIKYLKKGICIVAGAMAAVAIASIPVKAATSHEFLLDLPDGYSTSSTVYIDGLEIDKLDNGSAVEESGDLKIKFDSDDNKRTATMYKYNSNGIPVGMTVWKLNYSDGSEGSSDNAVVMDYFTDLLKYSGYSIFQRKDPYLGGIRVSTSIDPTTREALLTGDESVGGYKIVEYGHMAISETTANSNPDEYKNFVYKGKNAGSDYPLASASFTNDGDNSNDNEEQLKNGRVYFRTPLRFKSANNFDEQYYFRSYMLVESVNDSDDSFYLYGPIVHKSIVEVANQAIEAGETAVSMSYLKSVLGSVEYKGKTVVFLGDSLMVGDDGSRTSGFGGCDSGGYVSNPIHSEVSSKIMGRYNNISMNVEYHAMGGATFSRPGQNVSNTLYDYATSITANPDDVKLIILMGGANDWIYEDQHQGPSGKSSLFGDLTSDGCLKYHSGEVYDPSSGKFDASGTPYDAQYDNNYCFNVWQTLDYLTEKFPSAKVVLCTTNQVIFNRDPGLRGSTYNRNGARWTLNQYMYAQKQIARYFKNHLNKEVYIIDIYDEWVQESDSRFYSVVPDGLHPNKDGYDEVNTLIFNKLINGIIE